MTGTWALAALHLLGLAIALPAAWARGRALRRPLDREGLARALDADTWWGISAAVLIGSGLVRLLGPFDKGVGYYLANHLFWGKMGFLVVILALEVWPMVTFIQWRIQLARGAPVDTRRAMLFARISDVQLVLVLAMVLAATGMARGHGVVHP